MRYRADKSEVQSDGATVWYSEWMGGPSLSKIVNCRLETLSGDMRRTVLITGEADTFFSIPAVCRIAGKWVRGFITGDGDGNSVFHHRYF